MKKTWIILIIITIIIGGGIWWWYSTTKNTASVDENNNNTNTYQAKKSSTNINSTTNDIPKTTKIETEISSFSTKIYNKDKERQNNIAITCKALTTKEIQPEETFSFCNVVGKSTSAKGYKEADIYVDGEKKQGLGGGNCQVSTTLYNAVVKIPELEIVERHQHSGNVPYIKDGQDAAVAYGSYDFKFKNNTKNVIKIVMESTNESITARLIKIS